jgi:hypothetical protein
LVVPGLELPLEKETMMKYLNIVLRTLGVLAVVVLNMKLAEAMISLVAHRYDNGNGILPPLAVVPLLIYAVGLIIIEINFRQMIKHPKVQNATFFIPICIAGAMLGYINVLFQWGS